MKKIFSTQVCSWDELNRTIAKIKEAIGTPLLPSGFSDMKSLVGQLCDLRAQELGYASLVFEFKEEFQVKYVSTSGTYVHFTVYSGGEVPLAEVEVHLPDHRAVPGREAYESLTKALGWNEELECPKWVVDARETREATTQEIEAVLTSFDVFTRTSANRWVSQSGVLVARRDALFTVALWGKESYVPWAGLETRLKTVYQSLANRSRPWVSEDYDSDYDGAEYEYDSDYDGMDHDGPVD